MPNLKGVVSVVSQLKHEKVALRRQMSKIDAALAVLGKLNGGGSYGKPKRVMSVAARRKIAAAQRARWARVRAKG
jgi:hypothetical protein